MSEFQERCLTYSETAALGTVVEFLDDGMALVRTGSDFKEVCLEWISAQVGDTVIYHEGLALGNIS